MCIRDSADAARLGVVDDGGSFLYISVTVEEGVADACTGVYHRDGGILTDKVNEVAAAARDNQIDITVGMPKPVELLPGAHGKGLYSGQGVMVFSNNGENSAAAMKYFDALSLSLIHIYL